MSELEKLKSLAQTAGIDAEGLLRELKGELLQEVQALVSHWTEQLGARLEALGTQLREEVRSALPPLVEQQVLAALEPLRGAAEALVQRRQEEAQAPQALRGREELLLKGLELLVTVFQQADPVRQLNKLAALRQAFAAFEPPAPSPDTVFKIYADAAKLWAKGRGNGVSPLGGSGPAGSGEPPPGSPRSLADVVGEIG